MACTSALLGAFVKVSTRSPPPAGVALNVAHLLSAQWERLCAEASRLAQLLRSELAAVPFAMWHSLNSFMPVLKWGISASAARIAIYRAQCRGVTPCGDTRSSLRIGLGSPSTTGCLTPDGSKVLWSVFRDNSAGILRAMNELGLDIVGLPGARLPSDFKLPAALGLAIAARRGNGSSYDSIAAVWRCDAEGISEILDVGPCRRLWLLVCQASDVPFALNFTYLPAGSDDEGDAQWFAEVAGLESDICTLKQRLGQGLNLAVMRDMNVDK